MVMLKNMVITCCSQGHFFKLISSQSMLLLAPNVRRYVQLAQSRGGARFCTRGAMQGYDVICLFSRWQKP
jgi:hypothetical protein